MKIIAALLALGFTGVVSANGGLSIDNVEKHMAKPMLDKTSQATIDPARLAHGPILKFQVGDNKPALANTTTSRNRADLSI